MWNSSFKAMGTTVEVVIAVQESSAQKLASVSYEDVKATVDRLESKFTRFLETSELSYINAHPDMWIDVSEEMARVLQLASDANALSGGLFNPCLGRVMERIGYGETFEKVSSGNESRPVTQTNEPSHLGGGVQPRNGSQMQYMVLADLGRVYLFPGYKIDLGGIAKGWIVEQAAQVLQAHGLSDFVVSAGGDMVCSGKCEGQPWQVGITNPSDPNDSVLTLSVESSCVATSGTYKRRWTQDDEPMHHILDPMSQKPAQTDVISCTVLAPKLTDAEVYAKTALLLGSERGLLWLSQQNQLGWVMILANGEVAHAWND